MSGMAKTAITTAAATNTVTGTIPAEATPKVITATGTIPAEETAKVNVGKQATGARSENSAFTTAATMGDDINGAPSAHRCGMSTMLLALATVSLW